MKALYAVRITIISPAFVLLFDFYPLEFCSFFMHSSLYFHPFPRRSLSLSQISSPLDSEKEKKERKKYQHLENNYKKEEEQNRMKLLTNTYKISTSDIEAKDSKEERRSTKLERQREQLHRLQT